MPALLVVLSLLSADPSPGGPACKTVNGQTACGYDCKTDPINPPKANTRAANSKTMLVILTTSSTPTVYV